MTPYIYMIPWVQVHRGNLPAAREALKLLPDAESSADLQERMSFALGKAIVIHAEGSDEQALQTAEEAFGLREWSLGHEVTKEAFVQAVEIAFALGDLTKVEELLRTIDGVSRGILPLYLEAQSARFRARLSAARGGHDQVELGFKRAAGAFRELSIPFYLGATLLEHGEWLAELSRVGEAPRLLDEARGVFERLKADPWIERVDRVMPQVGSGRVGADLER